MIIIYCVACAKEVEAQALFGDSIYPHRPDLYGKKFLQCPHCGNYVGTHQDGRPLGTIPTPELRAMRNNDSLQTFYSYELALEDALKYALQNLV